MSELLTELNILLAKGIAMMYDAKNGFDIMCSDGTFDAWRIKSLAAINLIGTEGRRITETLPKELRPSYSPRAVARLVGGLEAAIFVIKHRNDAISGSNTQVTAGKRSLLDDKRVFIVHGHDELLLQKTARLIERIGLEPIILSEQPGKGKTIFEKLEAEGAVRFAIILLTPDDIGCSKSTSNPIPRARQNVILELGYFVGRLGRSRTAVLYDESVELPSDYRGIEYIKIDREGGWINKLIRELKASGLKIKP